jgi:hypothetical protein
MARVERASGLAATCRSTSAISSTSDCTGWRRSWLAAARNLDFDWLARSASLLAAASSVIRICRTSAISLNELATIPISSCDNTLIRALNSPAENELAARVIPVSPFFMPLVTNMTSNNPVVSTVIAVANSSLRTTLSSQREPSPRVNENSSSNTVSFSFIV